MDQAGHILPPCPGWHQPQRWRFGHCCGTHPCCSGWPVMKQKITAGKSPSG